MYEMLTPPVRAEIIQKQVEEARNHITEASRIILTLQDELDSQVNKLNQIIKEIEQEIRVCMFAAGIENINALQKAPLIKNFP